MPETHLSSLRLLLPAILKEIDPSQLKGSGDKALYSLLMSQALDKNRIDITDDSLISVAVDYYSGQSSEPRRQMLASFYMGRVQFNREDYAASMASMLRSLELSRQLSNPFWTGMSARGISDIYNESYQGAAEIKYAKIEYINFKEAGKQPYINYAILDIARAYYNSKNILESIKFARSACNSATIYKNDIDTANDFLLRLHRHNDISLDWLKYEIYTRTHQFKHAIRALERIDSATNEALRIHKTQNLSKFAFA